MFLNADKGGGQTRREAEEERGGIGRVRYKEHDSINMEITILLKITLKFLLFYIASCKD